VSYLRGERGSGALAVKSHAVVMRDVVSTRDT
jgi:hypothetical protein